MHGTLSRQEEERQTRIALNTAPPQLTLRLAPYLLVCRAHPFMPVITDCLRSSSSDQRSRRLPQHQFHLRTRQ
jgi:hypothetical protein